jgi:hypothetical protein
MEEEEEEEERWKRGSLREKVERRREGGKEKDRDNILHRERKRYVKRKERESRKV